MRGWINRDRDDFRTQSQDVGWGAWFVAMGVWWAAALTLMAALAAIGRPMWSLIGTLIAVTLALSLIRAYLRYGTHRSE